MSRVTDLTGKVFGQGTVQERDHSRGPSAFWFCKCACGKSSSVSGPRLINEDSNRCMSCAMKDRIYHGRPRGRPLIDLSGKVFGKLTVLRRDDSDYREGVPGWICQC